MVKIVLCIRVAVGVYVDLGILVLVEDASETWEVTVLMMVIAMGTYEMRE